MKLGKFIKKFSHNNLIRLLYKSEGGHKTVLKSWSDVSMDWEVNKSQGKNRHYIDNEVLELSSILVVDSKYPEALNIVIEELTYQPIIKEIKNNKSNYSELN
jgi:hypothetical protein